MPLLATAAFVLPLVQQPEPYQMPARSHEHAIMGAKGPVAEQTPKSIWRVASDGAGTHLQTSLTCAKTVGEFDRSQLHYFDGFGLDVGCNYNRPGDGTVTIYLTQRHGRPIAGDFTGADAAIKQRWPDVKVVDGAVPSPSGLAFQSVMYARADGTRTGLWVADVSGWTYSIRATYSPDLEPKVMSALTSLTDAMRSTAGTHLAICAAAPPETRNGAHITDEKRISSMSLVAGLLEASAKEKSGAQASFAEQWCAEEAAGDNDAPMLLWRNVALTGNAGPMDRMTLMTMGEPPALISFANPLASAIEKEASGKDALIYQLIEKRGDTTDVYAFFDGRPSKPALAPVAKEIFLGRQNPLTSFNAKSDTITISVPPSTPGS